MLHVTVLFNATQSVVGSSKVTNERKGICMRRSLFLILAGVLLATELNAQPVGGAPQLWFSPGDDLEFRGIVSHPDFPKLFEEPSLWPTGLSHINVIEFRQAYIARKPAESLKYYNYLKAHHIALAVAMTVMPAENCGQGIEGIMSRKGIDFYSKAIKGAGIDIDYVLMDEPLYFGHDYTGKDACRLPIADVARGVAESVATIRSYHPKAKFVLGEPVSLPGGVAELAEFLDAYKATTHEYPFSVELDVQWPKNWRSELPPLVNWLKARGIGYGIIYNATGGTKGDHAWVSSAKLNAQAVASAIHINPQHVMIQTWETYPVPIVPESNPDTMTGYLKWFVEHASH